MKPILLTLALAATLPAAAQDNIIRRTPVHQADVAAPNTQAVVMRVELDAGAVAGRHSHPGDEISYVLEGEGELLVDGEAPRRLRPGDAFVVPAGRVHAARNTGTVTMRLLGVFVVAKDKPLAKPEK